MPTRQLSPRESMLNPGSWPPELLALYAATSLDEFIEQAFAILPRIVPCDYVSAMYAGVGDSLLTERDSRGRVWKGTFMRRYTDLKDFHANPVPPVVATRSTMPISDEALKKTTFYRQVMLRQGWRHSVTLCFQSIPTSSSLGLALRRDSGRRDFSDEELADLKTMRLSAPWPDAAVQDSTKSERHRSMPSASTGAGRVGDRGIDHRRLSLRTDSNTKFHHRVRSPAACAGSGV